MDEKKRRKDVVSLPIGSVLGPMLARIREFAKQTAKVYFSDHALDQMEDRDLTDADVFEVLRLGDIVGNPWIEPKTNEHGCKVAFRRKGSRAIGVVTILRTDDGLFVKTVEWEDER